ncbi:MAG: hypothetical protein WBX81_12640 [Nitrososphaeraceae archaeon]
MLVKVNGINYDNKMVNVTELDIDDYGSVIPLEDLEFQLPSKDDSIVEILKNSQYAAISVQENSEGNGIITSADTMTLDELNKEKQKTIEAAAEKRDDS